MEGQRHRSAQRRRKKRRQATDSAHELVLIAARRPGAPVRPSTPRSMIAASAVPRQHRHEPAEPAVSKEPEVGFEPAPKRAARIVQSPQKDLDDRDRQGQRLLTRLLNSEGRGAISRAAAELVDAGFDFPLEQAVQIQLLEHFDEARARSAALALGSLLQREPPLKRPVLEQRLRRLEEHAEDERTREIAASLRRTLRC